jgi:hypothetical protein
MRLTLARYLNHTILVSVPALFEDGTCRPFTLLGTELHGLWLQSDELTRRLLPEDERDLAAAVFVPFAQIAGVLVAAGTAAVQHQPESAPADAAAGRKIRARSAAKNASAAASKR